VIGQAGARGERLAPPGFILSRGIAQKRSASAAMAIAAAPD